MATARLPRARPRRPPKRSLAEDPKSARPATADSAFGDDVPLLAARALGPESLNKGLDAVRRVLAFCVEEDQLDKLPDFKSAKRPKGKPNRSFLEPAQIEYLLRAATALEAEARGLSPADLATSRPPRIRTAAWPASSASRTPRSERSAATRSWPAAATTSRAARRCCSTSARARAWRRAAASTACTWSWPRTPGRVHIAGTKSDAGDRKLPLLPALREALLAHRADFPFDHREPVLMTRNGRRNTPNNITDTILAPTVERANELPEADGLPGIARLTMHSLRRTFASILAVCEVPEQRTITLLGHNDIKPTQSVYQQDLDLSDESIDALERVMGCTLDEAYEIRLWLGGHIPDVAEAVDSPRRLTDDEDRARSVLDLIGQVSTPVWGRDELATGDMWSSNSVIGWVIARSGIDAESVQPPAGGRAPGWQAGLVVARRHDQEAARTELG